MIIPLQPGATDIERDEDRARTEKPAIPRVAFQGELGAYSEEAVLRLFGRGAEPVPYRDFRAVGEAVATQAVEWGLLPIENSIAGSVVGSYDVLASTDLVIRGEVIIPIHHCLLGLRGASVEELTQILSHPVALAQCTRYLQARSGTDALAVYDTAGAAKEVAAGGDRRRGAIASREAAARYGLEILASDIEDRPDNHTRFLLVACSAGVPLPAAEAGPSTKVAFVTEAHNVPGALVGILRPFAERGINLSKLEARPAAEPWTYRFFVEVVSGSNADEVREALEEVKARSVRFRDLGSFPSWSGAGA